MLLRQMTRQLGAWISGIKKQDKEKRRIERPAHVQDENTAAKTELAELTKYEIRRREIAESTEQINGIFCICDGIIVPDYFSEYLASDQNNPKERVRYYSDFYDHYIKRKYPHPSSCERYFPHGRVDLIPNMTVIFIDKCYFEDEGMINQICELYRIAGKIYVICNSNYKCRVCKNMDGDDIMLQSYYIADTVRAERCQI